MESVPSRDASDTASVYSASSQSCFDSQSVSSQQSAVTVGGTPKRGRVKGMKKKVTGMFRKNRVSSASPVRKVRPNETPPLPPLIPTQVLRSPEQHLRPPLSGVAARRRNSAQQKASIEVVDANFSEDAKWDPTEVLFDNVSISDLTVKAHNPIKLDTQPAVTTKPTYSARDAWICLALVVLFSLSFEIRLRGVLFHSRGFLELYSELASGGSVLSVAAREVASLITSTLIVMTGIATLICSLDDF